MLPSLTAYRLATGGAAIAQKLNAKVAAFVHQILILLQDPAWSDKIRTNKLPQLKKLEKSLPPELGRQLTQTIKDAQQ